MGPWCTQMSAGGWLTMIASLVVVLALVLWTVGRLFPGHGTADPRALLDARLASGEIDTDAYRALRSTLDHVETYARKAMP